MDDAPSTAAGARYLFIFYVPHGTILDAWRPSGSGANFTLSRILSPLAAYQDRMTVIDGLDNISAPGQLTSTHIDGPRMLLTARATGGPSIDDLFLTPDAPSQIAAGGDVGAQDLMSASSATPTLVNYDPTRGDSDPSLHRSHRTIGGLSFLPGSAPAGSSDPDPTDMTRLDAGVRVDHRRPRRPVTTIPAAITLLGGPSLERSAAGCRLRALTLNQMAEASGTSPDAYINYQLVISQEVGYLIRLLDRITIAPGVTLLDRSLVMWISETGEASSHSGHNIPVVLIGNLGAALFARANICST